MSDTWRHYLQTAGFSPGDAMRMEQQIIACLEQCETEEELKAKKQEFGQAIVELMKKRVAQVQMNTAMLQAQHEAWMAARLCQHVNEVGQMWSSTLSNINAGWNEVWAQNRAQQQEQHIRMLRAISGSCLNCGSSCCHCAH